VSQALVLEPRVWKEVSPVSWWQEQALAGGWQRRVVVLQVWLELRQVLLLVLPEEWLVQPRVSFPLWPALLERA
jgi:hypothetical protein